LVEIERPAEPHQHVYKLSSGSGVRRSGREKSDPNRKLSLGKHVKFRDESRIHDRNEGEALKAAIEDLIRLDRYEKRAAPRQRRAIFALTSLNLMAQQKDQ
jgi:hypothetical protein